MNLLNLCMLFHAKVSRFNFILDSPLPVFIEEYFIGNWKMPKVWIEKFENMFRVIEWYQILRYAHKTKWYLLVFVFDIFFFHFIGGKIEFQCFYCRQMIHSKMQTLLQHYCKLVFLNSDIFKYIHFICVILVKPYGWLCWSSTESIYFPNFST